MFCSNVRISFYYHMYSFVLFRKYSSSVGNTTVHCAFSICAAPCEFITATDSASKKHSPLCFSILLRFLTSRQCLQQAAAVTRLSSRLCKNIQIFRTYTRKCANYKLTQQKQKCAGLFTPM